MEMTLYQVTEYTRAGAHAEREKLTNALFVARASQATEAGYLAAARSIKGSA